jgi:hypothetical protein
LATHHPGICDSAKIARSLFAACRAKWRPRSLHFDFTTMNKTTGGCRLPPAFVVVVLTITLLSASSTVAAEARIVLALTPTRVERFAAAELKKYLAAAAGVHAEIVTADAKVSTTQQYVFWVGNLTEPDGLPKKGFPADALQSAQLNQDGVCVDSGVERAILLGRGSRGALAAVYTYLERVLGCHWPEPGEDFVPKLVKWRPAPVRLIVNPTFSFRGVAIHGKCNKEYFALLVDWLAKNRMNAFQLHPGHYDAVRSHVLDAVLDRGLMPNIGGHSREDYLPTIKYQKEHPNWFAKTSDPNSKQLCYSNHESTSTYAANVVAYLKTHPEIAIVSLWPNDGYGFCECARCKASPNKGSDLLLSYVNRVAEKIHAQVSDVKIEYLAYIHYVSAPKYVKPLPYVTPIYCENYGSIGDRDHFHPITDDRSANKALRRELEKWIALSSQATEFSYYGDDCLKRFLYCPISEVIVADYRYYRKAGLAGNFVLLTNPESWWSHAMTLYACARAAWDAELDTQEIENDYYESLYGPAGKAMRQHAMALAALHAFPMTFATAEQHRVSLERYSQGIREAMAAMDRAQATQPRPYVQERIRKLRIDTEYAALWYQTQCDIERYWIERSPALKERIIASLDRALKLEVIVQDDLSGYRSASSLLSRFREQFTNGK